MGIITKNTTVTGSVFDTGEKGSQKKGTMSMRSVKKWAIAAGAALLLGTTGQMAQAASVNDVLQGLAFTNGFIGTQATYDFNDEDRSVLDAAGAVDGMLSVGDVIRGSFEITSVTLVEGAPLTRTAAFDAGGNNALFGRFALQIASITPVDLDGGGPDRNLITLTSTGDLGANILFEVYEAPTFDFDAVSAAADGGFAGVPAVAGSSLYASLGLNPGLTDDNTYQFLSTASAGTSTSLATLAGFASATNLFDLTNGRLDVLVAPPGGIGDTSVIASIGRFAPTGGAAIGSNVEGAGTSIISVPGSPGVFDSKVAFASPLTVIPTPAAFGVGLMGLGLVALRRPRRA